MIMIISPDRGKGWRSGCSSRAWTWRQLCKICLVPDMLGEGNDDYIVPGVSKCDRSDDNGACHVCDGGWRECWQRQPLVLVIFLTRFADEIPIMHRATSMQIHLRRSKINFWGHQSCPKPKCLSPWPSLIFLRQEWKTRVDQVAGDVHAASAIHHQSGEGKTRRRIIEVYYLSPGNTMWKKSCFLFNVWLMPVSKKIYLMLPSLLDNHPRIGEKIIWIVNLVTGQHMWSANIAKGPTDPKKRV